MKKTFLILMSLLALTSCNGILGKVAVESITLDKTSLTLQIGDSERLNATVLPTEASDKAIIWSSTDSDIATITDGVVTAVNIGQTTVTATSKDGRVSSGCIVTVIPNHVSVTSVSLDMTNVEMEPGDELRLNETVSPQNATNKGVKWSSSNSSVVTVSKYGLITATEEGTAIITVTTDDNAMTAECTVKVKLTEYVADGNHEGTEDIEWNL
ncbi:MAG: Ig domain-containing protein [Bacteroidales bacterium]|nr:Ig domain-containing protein [Bacteroidales bacterium]